MAENISVRIYGRIYQLKSGESGGGVNPEELASMVDGKMSELAKAKSTQSTQDLAILTALNLAGELEQEKEATKAQEEAIRRKMEDLILSLSQELEYIRK